MWEDGFKLEAKTAEEIEQIKTPSGMRQRIIHASMYNPLIRRVFDLAMSEGLSGEDMYTVLAYHALVRLQQEQEWRVEQVNMRPTPPIFVTKK